MSEEDLLQRIAGLEEELRQVGIRNERVDLDKAWERSFTRITLVMILTYLLIAIVFYLAAVPNFYFNAVVPTLGFFISTQSLPLAKNWWIKRH